ncbi:MAG TPA: THUMP domain-containing protein, partial [Nitrososphaera sp.]|nr:THUMP domain-containing protein [Nitrososphaera sp.]
MGGSVSADARNVLASKLKQYKMCRRCLERHGCSRLKPIVPCYICRGLMDKLDGIESKIYSAAKEYEFETFLIGAVLPTQIYEREDAMRARLKIRGRENVKNQLTRELGIKLSRATGKGVDYLRPDLSVNLVIDKENNVEVSTKSRPLMLFGRYTKKAPGLPQKQERCGSCWGKGCGKCGLSGLAGLDSVEGVLANAIMRHTKGQTPKFSWLGSEDRSSLVLGSGRPFYVKVFDPRKRNINRFRIRRDSIAAALVPHVDIANTTAHFIAKTRIQVKCERALLKQDLAKLRSVAGSEV